MAVWRVRVVESTILEVEADTEDEAIEAADELAYERNNGGGGVFGGGLPEYEFKVLGCSDPRMDWPGLKRHGDMGEYHWTPFAAWDCEDVLHCTECLGGEPGIDCKHEDNEGTCAYCLGDGCPDAETQVNDMARGLDRVLVRLATKPWPPNENPRVVVHGAILGEMGTGLVGDQAWRQYTHEVLEKLESIGIEWWV